VPIFLEKFILPLLVVLVAALAITNPMKFDVVQRITGALAIIFIAYFASHTLQVRNPSQGPSPVGQASRALESPSRAPGGPIPNKPQSESPVSSGSEAISPPQQAKPPGESKPRTPGPVATFPSNEQAERVRSRIRYLVTYLGAKVFGLYEVFGPVGDNVLDAPQMFDQRGVIKHLASTGEIKIVQETPDNIVFEVQDKLLAK
jgi:hypothetical protein